MFQLKWVLSLAVLFMLGCDPAPAPSTIASESASPEPQVAPQLDIEALLAMPGDVALGKQIAQERCSNCHGSKGVSGRIGAPFIAGQSYEYLIRAMTAYATEQRDHLAMKVVVDELGSEALVNVSRYYAAQDKVKWDPSVASAQSDQTVMNTRTIAAGERLSTSCASCHGDKGVSSRPGMPSLAGMHAEYFVKTLNEFFDGQRDHEVMAIFSASVPQKNAELLAAYYGSLKPKKSTNPIIGNAKRGRNIAIKECAGCHGTDGNSIAPLMPSLAGQDSSYLSKTTLDYRNGLRRDGMMAKATKGMSDQQINDVSAYFASQRPDPYIRAASYVKGQFNPLRDASKMAKSCDGCHGPDGNSLQAGMPSLTGLTPEYLVASTLSYRDGSRQHPEMEKVVDDLSDLDIEKISYYYATQNTSSSNMVGKGDVLKGKKQSAVCAGCHGDIDRLTDSLMPILAGQNAAYIIQASEDYISEKRQHRVMRDAVVVLPKDVLINIAAYYATLQPEKPDVRMPKAPEILVTSCESCHGPKGYSKTAGTPRLAGQVEAYLARVLRQYSSGERISSSMHGNAITLTQLESQAIASYYAAQ